jgi:hypothetical protein
VLESGESAAPAVEGLAGSVRLLTSALEALLGRPSESGLRDLSWLKGVSVFMLTAGAWVPLILQKLAESVCVPQGKKKGKKGKGAEEPTSGPKDAAALSGAVKGAVEAFLHLLRYLESRVREDAALHVEAEGAFDRLVPPGGMATFIAEGDFRDLRDHVLGKIRESHRVSCDRLAEVLRRKIDGLRVAVPN